MRRLAVLTALGCATMMVLGACGSAAAPSPSRAAAGRSAPGAGPVSKAPVPVTVRFSLNPAFYSYLPVFLAIDRGYFKQEGLNVQVTRYNTSAGTQIPMLARGDLDITNVIASPALFNQFTEGFNIKLIMVSNRSAPGWHDTAWAVVRQDLWSSGRLRHLSQLRGMKVDGAFLGSPDDLLGEELVAAAGLKLSQVDYTTREASPADQVAALRNHAVDVQVTTEPTAISMQLKGYGHEWKSMEAIAPWVQTSFLGASAAFVKKHPGAVTRFLAALLRADHAVVATGGRWTPATMAEVVKWTGFPKATVEKLPGPSYPCNTCRIDPTGLQREEQLWVSRGLVKTPVPVNKIIDSTFLDAALKEVPPVPGAPATKG